MGPGVAVAPPELNLNTVASRRSGIVETEFLGAVA
jgi:hypothetical protein